MDKELDRANIDSNDETTSDSSLIIGNDSIRNPQALLDMSNYSSCARPIQTINNEDSSKGYSIFFQPMYNIPNPITGKKSESDWEPVICPSIPILDGTSNLYKNPPVTEISVKSSMLCPNKKGKTQKLYTEKFVSSFSSIIDSYFESEEAFLKAQTTLESKLNNLLERTQNYNHNKGIIETLAPSLVRDKLAKDLVAEGTTLKEELKVYNNDLASWTKGSSGLQVYCQDLIPRSERILFDLACKQDQSVEKLFDNMRESNDSMSEEDLDLREQWLEGLRTASYLRNNAAQITLRQLESRLTNDSYFTDEVKALKVHENLEHLIKFRTSFQHTANETQEGFEKAFRSRYGVNEIIPTSGSKWEILAGSKRTSEPNHCEESSKSDGDVKVEEEDDQLTSVLLDFSVDKEVEGRVGPYKRTEYRSGGDEFYYGIGLERPRNESETVTKGETWVTDKARTHFP
ncbi:uncharacterized protein L201_007260 [Kwoniella dendrophila CBS 6074]|uniref:Uncharacterized protein n=1 Tax=Kwoniella dendrophila CBS 6074 TaxID=1295534 RepID=A0AAX4K3L1_9TREE